MTQLLKLCLVGHFSLKIRTVKYFGLSSCGNVGVRKYAETWVVRDLLHSNLGACSAEFSLQKANLAAEVEEKHSPILA